MSDTTEKDRLLTLAEQVETIALESQRGRGLRGTVTKNPDTPRLQLRLASAEREFRDAALHAQRSRRTLEAHTAGLTEELDRNLVRLAEAEQRILSLKEEIEKAEASPPVAEVVTVTPEDVGTLEV